MARHYARIFCAVWDDPDFRQLSIGARCTYLMLISQTDVSACGTLALTVRRWAATYPPDERDGLAGWLEDLRAANFILVDWDTEELLIRTFVKYDGGATNPKRVKAIDSASIGIRSPILRSALAVEMSGLGLTPQFVVPAAVSAGQYPTDRVSDTQPDTRRVVVESVATSTATHNPETTTREPARPKAPRATSQEDRGTRLPDDFEVTAEMAAWAKREHPGVDIRLATEKFRNHWISKTGRDATKRQWPATWRNWIINEDQRATPRSPTPPRRRYDYA